MAGIAASGPSGPSRTEPGNSQALEVGQEPARRPAKWTRATAVQVDIVVARTQRGPRRPQVGDETYVRWLVKEETRRLEEAQLERWKR